MPRKQFTPEEKSRLVLQAIRGERTINEIGNRIFGIEAIHFMELFHQWDETVHIRPALPDVYNRYVLVRTPTWTL